MAKRSKKTQKSQARQTKVKDFVVVVFADDQEQAEYYETLLRNNDIPAVINEQNEPSTDEAQIAVMVPEEFLDEAHVVIESQDVYDDFYDFASEDEDNEDFETEFLDDEN